MRILAAVLISLPSLVRAQFGTPSDTANTVANVLGVAANVSQAANVDALANVFGNASNVASEVRLKISFRDETVWLLIISITRWARSSTTSRTSPPSSTARW